jgi:hypothetical protein
MLIDLYTWISAHHAQAIATLIAVLMFLQVTFENWHVTLGWNWAGRLALFLASFPLSGSMTGMVKAFSKSTPLPPVAPTPVAPVNVVTPPPAQQPPVEQK